MRSTRPHNDSPLDAPPLTEGPAILIVDEDPAFQLGLRTFLREYVGFENVFIARNGQDALDFIRADTSIEVVTLDFHMPGMTGIEVLQILRDEALRPLAVIMITGFPSDELEAEFHALGTDSILTTHFISKPVHFEKLEHLILSSQEEVNTLKLRAQEQLETEVSPFAAPVLPEKFLADKLDSQASRLDELESQLKSQRGKWRSDFWKIACVILAFWLAGEFGLLKKIEPQWEQFKETITTSFNAKFWKKSSAEEMEKKITPSHEEKGEEKGQPL